MKPKVMILHAPGTNRTGEIVEAISLAGGNPSIIHTSRLLQERDKINQYQMIVIPGGFSYGDDLGAGKMLSLVLYKLIRDNIVDFIDSDKMILGVCNGFQTLIHMNVLPDKNQKKQVSLVENENGSFECRWVYMAVHTSTKSWILEPLKGRMIYCPVAHKEGKLLCDDFVASSLGKSGNIALQYVDSTGGVLADYPWNPNGSISNIAGLCNNKGNVLGLMPHPENNVYMEQKPSFAQEGSWITGLPLFKSAIGLMKG